MPKFKWMESFDKQVREDEEAARKAKADLEAGVQSKAENRLSPAGRARMFQEAEELGAGRGPELVSIEDLPKIKEKPEPARMAAENEPKPLPSEAPKRGRPAAAIQELEKPT